MKQLKTKLAITFMMLDSRNKKTFHHKKEINAYDILIHHDQPLYIQRKCLGRYHKSHY